MARCLPARRASRSTCCSSRMNGGSRRRTFGSALVPARMSHFEQLRLHFLRGPAAAAGPVRKPAPWKPVTGPTMQVSRMYVRHAPHVARAGSRDSMASITASIAAQAMGPPPNVVPSASSLMAAATFGDISSAAHGEAVAERLGDGDHVRQHAVEIRGERMARAAHAALHFVEDQQRAGFVAALAQRLRDTPRRSRTRRRGPARAR